MDSLPGTRGGTSSTRQAANRFLGEARETKGVSGFRERSSSPPGGKGGSWLRGLDLHQRPFGYELHKTLYTLAPCARGPAHRGKT